MMRCALLFLLACSSHHAPAIDAQPSNPLFQSLFGANDAMLPGRTCRTTHDDCRGSARLFVCNNGTCGKCTTNADCTSEYQYLTDQFDDFITCLPDGTCGFATQPIGSCGGDVAAGVACRTAMFSWYACIDGTCAACTTADQCSSTYGPYWICSAGQAGSTGDCRESVPPP